MNPPQEKFLRTPLAGLIKCSREPHYARVPQVPQAGPQGHTEVRWRPGQERSLAPPFSNLRFFGSKCTVLKEVLATLLGLFGARGIVCPFSSLLRPCTHPYDSFL